MTILVTGKSGQLGSEIQALKIHFPQYQFHFTDEEDLDITDEVAVKNYFNSHHFDALINCAAYTAVDKAEVQIELANAVNHLGVRYLVEACKNHNIKLVHISTDYVFDGESNKPYNESDETNPKSVYGMSKLAGESAMIQVNPTQSIIIRTSWLYSTFGSNFVKTMLRLGNDKQQLNVVNDQIGSPTYAQDLAKTILNILPKLNNEEVEVFHYANKGRCSWYDFAKAIFKFKGLDCMPVPIPTKDYPTPAKRPQFSVLDTQKIQEQFNLDISDWEMSLKQCLLSTK